ncbi:MAG: hypothetical protein R6U17_00755 [Thermoplasmata archaeon]
MTELDDIFIEDIEELESLLQRTYWIEDEFEQMAYWEGFSTLHEQYRDVIFRLPHDSEKHKIMLNKIINSIEGIELEDIKKGVRKREEGSSRRQKMDEEVLTEMIKNDRLALDLYSKIHKHTSREFIEEIWTGENSNEFFDIFKRLMAEEQKHIDILRPHVGKLERIR